MRNLALAALLLAASLALHAQAPAAYQAVCEGAYSQAGSGPRQPLTCHRIVLTLLEGDRMQIQFVGANGAMLGFVGDISDVNPTTASIAVRAIMGSAERVEGTCTLQGHAEPTHIACLVRTARQLLYAIDARIGPQ